jgi:hypothetical protein
MIYFDKLLTYRMEHGAWGMGQECASVTLRNSVYDTM